MKKRILTGCLLLLFGITVFGQAVVISKENTQQKYEETKWGPNRSAFGYWQFNYGLPIPVTVDNNLKIASSSQLNFGYTIQKKLLSFSDVLFNLSYHNLSYRYNDATVENLGTVMNWDKYFAFQNGIEGGLALRFHLSPRRGNFLGTFVDIGLNASYNISSGFLKKDKDKGEGIRTQVRDKENAAFEALSYGPGIVIGRNQIAAFAKYNISNVMSDNADNAFPDLPHLVFGIQLNLFSY